MDVAAVQALASQSFAAAPAPAPPERVAEQKELIQAVRSLNQAELFGQNNELTFVLDRDTHRTLVRLVDRETREVIRQIPPEYVLRVAEGLRTYEG